MADLLKKRVIYSVKVCVRDSRIVEDPLTNNLVFLKTATAAVVVKDRSTAREALWPVPVFRERHYRMNEYLKIFSKDSSYRLPLREDPFYDVPEQVLIGRANLWLMSLVHLVEVEDIVDVVDDSGTTVGQLHAKINFANLAGEICSDPSNLRENLSRMLGQRLDLVIQIEECLNISRTRVIDIFVRYRFFEETADTETKPYPFRTSNPVFKFQKHVIVHRVTPEFVSFVEEKPFVLEVWGSGVGVDPLPKSQRVTESPFVVHLQQRLLQSESSLTRVTSSFISSQKQISQLENRITVSNQNIQKLQKQLEQDRSVIAELNSKLRESQSALRTAEAKATASETALQLRISELQFENKRLRKQLPILEETTAPTSVRSARPSVVPPLSVRSILPLAGRSGSFSARVESSTPKTGESPIQVRVGDSRNTTGGRRVVDISK
eukprot:c10126_g5_i2.p1 GENE.c10126_g5_i2~~c10126_g5_i2.p1  ORF type:complete len:450 (+),score=113.96 c10126_g5_i2:40-1350(+)